jgi:hypothetical protein
MKGYGESYTHRRPKHPHCGHPRHHGEAHRLTRGGGRRPEAAFRRRFFSRDERVAGLEQYLSDLRAEAQAVEEKLARLRATD